MVNKSLFPKFIVICDPLTRVRTVCSISVKEMFVCLSVSLQFLSEGDQQARQQQEIETLEKTLTLQEKVSGFVSRHRQLIQLRTDVMTFMKIYEINYVTSVNRT